MTSNDKSLIEFYVLNNLPRKFDTNKITLLITDLLEDGDKVVYYISGSKFSSEIIFTREKLIIAQRFSGEWGGDLVLPYDEIHRLKIKKQNSILFFKLDLIVELEGIKFYVKKSEADNFKKILWHIFDVK